MATPRSPYTKKGLMFDSRGSSADRSINQADQSMAITPASMFPMFRPNMFQAVPDEFESPAPGNLQLPPTVKVN